MIRDNIFNPKTVAVIGATDREGSVGRGVVENLKTTTERKVYFVNIFEEQVFEEKTYKNINDINDNIDLAVIIVPKTVVSQVVDDCVKKEVGGVLIISSGFAETGKEGEEEQRKISEKLKEAGIPLIGPNCLGILRPPFDFNASFAPGSPKSGEIAFISQSGGLIDAVISDSEEKNYGFSLIISVGNSAGLRIEDYIKIADSDEETKVITLYVEGVTDGRSFMKTIQETKKPVVILKAGKMDQSKKAVMSHTGMLAGEYRIFSSAVKQAKAVEVESLEEMFDVAKALSWQKKAEGGGVGIVTNGGGAGILLADLIYKEGLELPQSIKNPLDIIGDASPEDYEKGCSEMIKQEDVSLMVVIQTPQIVTKPLENANRIKTISEKYKKPVVVIFMGLGGESKEAVRYLEENKIPNYTDPKRALKPILAIINKI
ncbi:MAG: CoA-binding protein [Candidatus Pacebacteria bacterium]|nr:CoA-binding protein [Candidatus Paceibacterota bacterium]